MSSRGIRAKPEEVIFSIYKDGEIYQDNIILPSFLRDEEKLSYLRNTLKNIFIEFNVNYGNIKIMEGNIRSFNKGTFRRIENETIIKEVLSSSGIEHYKMLNNSKFSKLLDEYNSIVTELIKGKQKKEVKYQKKNF